MHDRLQGTKLSNDKWFKGHLKTFEGNALLFARLCLKFKEWLTKCIFEYSGLNDKLSDINYLEYTVIDRISIHEKLYLHFVRTLELEKKRTTLENWNNMELFNNKKYFHLVFCATKAKSNHKLATNFNLYSWILMRFIKHKSSHQIYAILLWIIRFDELHSKPRNVYHYMLSSS